MDYENERNAEYYSDPTACRALRNIESEERAKQLLSTILSLIYLSDFKLQGRIHLKDKRTGREYK